MSVKIIFVLIAPMLTSVALSAEKILKETSVDLYCKSLVFGYIDTRKHLGTLTNNDEKFNKTAVAMEKFCRDTPAPKPVPAATMSPTQIALASCVGFAGGAQLAHQLNVPSESYTVLDKRRNFAMKACESNPKRFQNDIFEKGPDYVLTQKY